MVIGESRIHYYEAPVECCQVSDTVGICAVLKSRILAENKIIPDPTPEERKRRASDAVQAFGFKSWSTLSRGAQTWGISKRPEVYTITPSRKVRGGFRPDRQNMIILPLALPVDEVCARIVAIVQQAVPSKP